MEKICRKSLGNNNKNAWILLTIDEFSMKVFAYAQADKMNVREVFSWTCCRCFQDMLLDKIMLALYSIPLLNAKFKSVVFYWGFVIQNVLTLFRRSGKWCWNQVVLHVVKPHETKHFHDMYDFLLWPWEPVIIMCSELWVLLALCPNVMKFLLHLSTYFCVFCYTFFHFKNFHFITA